MEPGSAAGWRVASMEMTYGNVNLRLVDADLAIRQCFVTPLHHHLNGSPVSTYGRAIPRLESHEQS